MKPLFHRVLQDAVAVPYRLLAPFLIRLSELVLIGAGLLLLGTLFLHGLGDVRKLALVSAVLLAAAAIRRTLLYLLDRSLDRDESVYF